MAGGVAGTYGGTTLGGIVGTAIGTLIAPGPGTAIGAKIGSAIGGLAGGLGLGMGSAMGSKKILDQFAEDDAKIMFSIAQEAIVDLAIDYLITEDEFKAIESHLNKTITAKWLENMYQIGYNKEDKASVQLKFAYEQLEPIFEQTIKTRTTVSLPNKRSLKKEIRKTYRYLLYQYFVMKFKNLIGIKTYT